MAETEKVSEADRMEQAGLERAIADIERVALSSPPGTRPFFNGALLNARARLGFLEKKIHDEEQEQRQHETNEAAVANLVQKESGLNEKEKETYGGFLKKEFFTKRDFAKLDEFYTHSWDRLSEDGKDQMSHRIWEGVRREEYKFTELPKSVQEKEAKQAYKRLQDSSIGLGSAVAIPQKDRDDFIHAYEGGKREEAEKILERPSFKANMFRQEGSREIRQTAVERGKQANSTQISANVGTDALQGGKDTPKPQEDSPGQFDFSSVKLNGVKAAENPSEGAVANLPRTQGGAARQC